MKGKEVTMRKFCKLLSVVLAVIIITSFVPAMETKAANNNPYLAWISIFDPAYYTANNAQASAYAAGDINKLWQYFVKVGIPNGDQASEEFNVFIYAKNYPDLQKAFGGNMIQYYIHYAQAGKAQGYNAKTLNTTSSTASTQTTTNSVVSKYPANDARHLDGTYVGWFEDFYDGTFGIKADTSTPYNMVLTLKAMDSIHSTYKFELRTIGETRANDYVTPPGSLRKYVGKRILEPISLSGTIDIIHSDFTIPELGYSDPYHSYQSPFSSDSDELRGYSIYFHYEEDPSYKPHDEHYGEVWVSFFTGEGRDTGYDMTFRCLRRID